MDTILDFPDYVTMMVAASKAFNLMVLPTRAGQNCDVHCHCKSFRGFEQAA